MVSAKVDPKVGNGFVKYPVAIASVLAVASLTFAASAYVIDKHTEKPHEGAVRSSQYSADLDEIQRDIRGSILSISQAAGEVALINGLLNSEIRHIRARLDELNSSDTRLASRVRVLESTAIGVPKAQYQPAE